MARNYSSRDQAEREASPGQIVSEVGVDLDQGVVILDFGQPLRATCFTADEADALADALSIQARRLRLALAAKGGA